MKPASIVRLPGTRRAAAQGPRQMPWAFAVPGLVLVLAAHIAPAIAGGWYAFTDWNGIDANPEFVGLGNFRAIFQDADIHGALTHTLFIAVLLVVLTNVIGLVLALGLNRGLKSRLFLRSVFFLPVAVSPLAVAFVWRFIFDSNGALNTFLGAVGLDGWERPWLGEPQLVLWLVLVVMVWQFAGLAMIIYLAGLQGIPSELDESAAVDGAGGWMRFREITLPLLAPAVTVCATFMLIHGLRVFDEVMALTNGGPAGASETLATQVYKQAFLSGRFGYSAALALMLAVLVAACSMVQLAILRAREGRMS